MASNATVPLLPNTTATLIQLQARLAALEASVEVNAFDLTSVWVILAGAFVLFMQGGFSLLEAGGIRKRNVSNVLFKNLLDTVIAAISYYCVGYAFAYGEDVNGFIGRTYFALSKLPAREFYLFFFQFAFVATAATIVSGGAAGRCSMIAYATYSFVLSAFVYPIQSHWFWSVGGWLSPFSPDRLAANNFIDFAGSTIVHAVGGMASLVASIFLGPRLERKKKFDNKDYSPIAGHSTTLAQIGTIILFTSWISFNAGSTLLASGGAMLVAARVAVVTVLSAASGCLTSVALYYVLNSELDLSNALNGLLAGLVGITSGCATVWPWAGLVIGCVSSLAYYGFARLLARLRIDDPIGAAPVHMAAGIMGTLWTGLLSYPELISEVYGVPIESVTSYGGFIPGGGGKQFGIQFLGVLCAMVWTGGLMTVVFAALKIFKVLRVSEEVERRGLDVSKHGGAAYPEDLTASQLHQILLRVKQEAGDGKDFDLAADYELSQVSY